MWFFRAISDSSVPMQRNDSHTLTIAQETSFSDKESHLDSLASSKKAKQKFFRRLSRALKQKSWLSWGKATSLARPPCWEIVRMKLASAPARLFVCDKPAALCSRKSLGPFRHFASCCLKPSSTAQVISGIVCQKSSRFWTVSRSPLFSTRFLQH